VTECIERSHRGKDRNLPSRSAGAEAVYGRHDADRAHRNRQQGGAAGCSDGERRAQREKRDDGRKEAGAGRAMAVDEDGSAMHRVTKEASECRPRGIDASEARRDSDPFARRNGAEDRRVVVRETHVAVPRPECRKGRQQQLTRREETCRALREAVELLHAEARRSRPVEVVPPGELCKQPPKHAVRRVGIDDHMSVPHAFADLDAIAHETQGVRLEPDAGIEEQRQLPFGRLEARPPGLEPTLSGPPNDP